VFAKPQLPWYVAHKCPKGLSNQPRAWTSNSVGSTVSFAVDIVGKGTRNLWYLKSPYPAARDRIHTRCSIEFPGMISGRAVCV